MKKQIALLAGLVFSVVCFTAISQEVISSSGGQDMEQDVQVSWTIGVPVIETLICN